MSPEQVIFATYFDTPARAERLQLLQHLVRNADDVVYLRAPAGAGKTLFAQRLLERLGNEIAVVWLRAGLDEDVPGVVADQLGLDPGEVLPWPDGLFAALGGQDLLVVVDDADQLGLGAFERLSVMHERGGRLLLLGEGRLANATGNWDLQFVDLPGFSSQQTAAFLRSRADDQAERITDDVAAALHRAAHGMPGPLLEALEAMLARGRPRAAPPSGPKKAARHGPGNRLVWAGGAVAVLVLGGLLFFQDAINALFEPAGSSSVAEHAVTGSAGTAEQPRAPDPVPQAPPREVADSLLPPLEPAGLPELPAPAPSAPPPPAMAREEQALDPLEAVLRDALAARDDKASSGLPVRQSATPPTADELQSPHAGQPGPAAPPAPAEPPALTPAPVTASSAERPAPVVRSKPAPAVANGRPTATTAAPVERPAAADAAAPVTLQAPTPAKVESRTAPAGGVAWLESRKPQRYTLQLVGARDRAAIDAFIREHAIAQPHAVFERTLNGRPWYSLVAGDYPDRAAAVAARDRLPRALKRADVWPRSFESIQKNL